MFTQIAKKTKRALWYPAKNMGITSKLVLFIPGFPKYPGPSDLIHFWTELGYDVLVPMYSGTFESSGSFSIEQSCEDVKTWHAFLKKGVFSISAREKHKRSISEIILFSSSFGSLIAGLSLKKHKLAGVRTCIFVSPLWDMTHFRTNTIHCDNVREQERLMIFSYPKSYRFKDKRTFFSQLLGKRPIKGVEKAFADNTKSFHIFAGKEDRLTPPAMAESLAREHKHSRVHLLAGGHSSKIDRNTFERICRNLCSKPRG